MDFVLWLSITSALLAITTDCAEDIEWCIDSKHHKKRPSEESVLYKQCRPWKNYSCCNQETTFRAHQPVNQYNFNFNHCPEHQMSEQCKRHFVQDLCFYECEPYVKPWVVAVNRSFASQRIFNVPICASDCDLWWSDCRHDYTCAANWARDFRWVNGTNQCQPESQCLPMNLVFDSAQQFCEMVWDHSWKYTTEDTPCMRIWFNPEYGNPNKATAEFYANSRGEVHTSIGLTLILSSLLSFLSDQ